jgi:D-alanine transaminase
MPDVIYLNGRIVAPEEAVVSIDDRGFLFGDAVYEYIRSYHGRLWCFKRHLHRLEENLAALAITGDVEAIGRAVQETYAASGLPNAGIYIHVTRGVAPRAHAYHAGMTPTVLITVRDITPALAAADPNGVSAITTPDLRWRRCDIKSTNLLPNILAKTKAYEAGVYEAILVDPDGCITEGSSTSVFWVQEGVLCTVPPGPEVLPSVTRALVLEIAREQQLPLREERIALDDFRRADEIFLASTTPEVCPIITLDGAPVADGRPGPITRRLQLAFRKKVEAGEDGG